MTQESSIDKTNDSSESQGSPTAFLAHVTEHKPLSQADIRRVLSHTHKRPGPLPEKMITIDGKRYIQADVHKITYNMSTGNITKSTSSLVDRGANGGMAGSDVRLLEASDRFADITGIDEHSLMNLRISTVSGVAQSHQGPVCLIMHQYAYHGKGKTIHSSGQRC